MDIKKFKIASVRNDGKIVKIFTLSSTNGDKINFKPGQFVNLYLLENGDFSIFRQFSIASSPSSSKLEFCIKILAEGKFTSVLDKLPLGSEIGLAGPFGHFAYQDQKECAFVAAGTGVAPMLSMLRHINEKKIEGEFTLLYSNKTKDSILYYNELKQLQAENKNIKIVFTLTQETPANWDGELGRIDQEMVERHIKRPNEKMWYFCGPVEFVKTIKEHALGKGAQPDKIKIEGWG